MKDQKNKTNEVVENEAEMAPFSMSQAAADGRSSQVKRKILVVGKEHAFTPEVMDYAVSLAQRLGYDLVGMNLKPALEQPGKFFSPYNQHLRAKFTKQAREAWEQTKTGLRQQGIRCEHVVRFNDVAKAVKDLNQRVKRIDFVITDVGINSEEITGEIPLPVFSISGYEGEQVMAQEQESKQKQAGGQNRCLRAGHRGHLCRGLFEHGHCDAIIHQGRLVCGAAHCHGVSGLLCARRLCP